MLEDTNFPAHSLTFIVKGTFDLKPSERLHISNDQLFPTGDEFYPEDENMLGGPRYASDFAYFKSRADLLLSANVIHPKEKKFLQVRLNFKSEQNRNR